MRRLFFLTLVLLLAASFASGTDKLKPVSLPLTFEPNRGQVAGTAAYLSRSSGADFAFDNDGFTALLSNGKSDATIQVQFEGANQVPALPESKTGGVSNYYLGPQRTNWLEGIPQFRQLRYPELYPGVDAVFHGREGRLEYDFEVKPGASPDQIILSFGPDSYIELINNGSLFVRAGGQELSFLAPEVFQTIYRQRKAVQGTYRLLDKHRVAFTIGEYDRSALLTIDPVVVYTRLVTSIDPNTVTSATTDGSGKLYLTGEAPIHNDPADVIHITKLDPTGETILFSTRVIGGTSHNIIVDSSGNSYVAGQATASDFPTTSQTLGVCPSSCNAGFVAKFDSAGQIVFSTLLGSGSNFPKAIALTGAGKLLIAGMGDPSLPIVNAFQPFTGGQFCLICSAPYFARLNESGTAFDFASFFGQSGWVSGIATDASGNFFLSGRGFVPLVNPLLNGYADLFVAKFSADGQTLLASTQFGGSEMYTAPLLAVNSSGSVCIAGDSQSNPFPYTLNAYRLPTFPLGSQPSFYRMFAACFESDLSVLKFSTYLGLGHVNAVGVDASDNFYVAGSFGPEPLPLKNAVVSDITHGGFILALDNNGALSFATQYGSENVLQIPTAMAVHSSGNIFFAGVIGDDIGTLQADTLSDPVNVGTGPAYDRQQELWFPAYFAAKISPDSRPQVSLGRYTPYLTLRNAGSADLHISSITGKDATGGNCANTVPAGTSCILHAAASTVTITSDAQPGTQSFSPVDSAGTVGLPLLLRPRQLFFPPQQLNTASPSQVIHVTNVQSVPQAISSITANGYASQTNDCPATLDAGASCTINVSIIPSAAQGVSTISIVLPGQPDPMDVKAYLPIPGSEGPILLSTDQLPFGDVPVGKSSLNLVLNVFNTSNTAIATPSASISGSSAFAITGTTCAGSLSAHQGCAFSVQFTPAANGNSSGTLNVSAGSGAASAQLYGTGKISSSVTVSPLQLTLYYPVLGVATFPTRVELTNTAQSPVAVTGISFDLPDFQQTNTCQSPLAPGGKCAIDVTITAQDLGDRSGSMQVDFDTAASQRIPLSAFAKYPVNALTAAVDFGNYTPVGIVSDPLFVDLYSNAQSGIHITFSVSISGPFEITEDNCNNQIPSYTICRLGIAFHPIEPGPQHGALTISYPGISQQTVIPLSGDTSSAGILIFPRSVGFPNTAAKTVFGPFTVTLRNPMSFAVTIPQPTLTGPGANLYQVTDPCDTIQAGASCDVKISFAPLKGGTFSATLTFQNGGTPATLIPITLAGTSYDIPGFEAYWTDGNFYNVDVGKSSRQVQLTVQNQRAEAHALPSLTLSGNQAGDFTAIPDSNCQMVAAYGTCIVRLTFTPTALGPRSAVLSFDSQSTDGHIVQIPLSGRGTEFKFSASNVTTASITAGQIATFDLQLEASVAPYGSVDITCTPVGANYGTCRFIQSFVNLDTGTGKVTINISPAGPGSANLRRKNGSFYSSLFVAVSLPFATFFAIRRRNGLFATMVLLVASLMLTSCGGGAGSSGGTPPPTRTTTTYTYTVTATNYEGTSRTTQLTVTVTSN